MPARSCLRSLRPQVAALSNRLEVPHADVLGQLQSEQPGDRFGYNGGGPVYDAAGNVTQDAVNKYAYDSEGRLCAVQNLLTTAATQYIYDAEGRRVA